VVPCQVSISVEEVAADPRFTEKRAYATLLVSRDLVTDALGLRNEMHDSLVAAGGVDRGDVAGGVEYRFDLSRPKPLVRLPDAISSHWRMPIGKPEVFEKG
jgi:hypothetical protein